MMPLSMLSLLLLIVSAHSQLTPYYEHDGAQIGQVEPKTPRLIGGGRKKYVTETVYGFLDFTTTVGSSVMVFTPQSEIASIDESSVIVTMTSVPPVATNTLEEARPSEKSKRRTNNAPTGLAKLLQEALSLKHSKTPKKKEEKPSTLAPVAKKVITLKPPILEPSIYVPEEAIVSAGQQLPSISVLGPFNTNINNDLSNNLRYDYAIAEPKPSANAKYALVDVDKDQLTGLVTTLGGTIVADGQTTIHKTSVIGTYIGGQYAQVLKSTSLIFNSSPVRNNLVSPTPRPTYESIRASAFPIRSQLSTVTPDRKPRYEQNYRDKESSLTKRRGPNHNERDYYYADGATRGDPLYDEYDDVSRAALRPRPSFKSPNIQQSSIFPTKAFVRTQPPSTFRHRYKSGSTRNTPPSFRRNSPPPLNFNRDRDRFRLSANTFTSNKPKPKPKPTTTNNNKKKKKQNRRPPLKNRLITQVKQTSELVVSSFKPKENIEETVRITSSRPVTGSTDRWFEIIILKSLHTYRLGAHKNTRYRTYTRTNTHTIEPTSQLVLAASSPTVYENPPLFENILHEPKEIYTLPPITVNGQDLNTLLQITTETIKNVETMYKTSVLPVQQNSELYYQTLVQTYYITRIITAVKTIPPYQKFNEYNGPLAVGETENILSLQPGEREYDENGAIRERIPQQFQDTDTTLKELVGAKFNPEALERQPYQKPTGTTENQQLSSQLPHLVPDNKKETQNWSPTIATPALSPEALQMYYLRLMMGGFPSPSKTTVSSSLVLITTNIITTETNVLAVTLNARRIETTISSTFLKRTILTSYYTTTVTAAPNPQLLGGFPFPSAPIPFQAG